jgi:eukaryotic-like serine/threonine-protein kinase
MPHSAPCPPTLDLKQFLLGQMDVEVARSLENHLLACPDCQKELTTISAEDEFVQTVRTASKWTSVISRSSLPEVSEDLVKLLVPHLKNIAASLEETGMFVSAQANEDTTGLGRSSKVGLLRSSEAATPQHLGRYKIHGVLGSGGMGTVLHAFDPLLKRFIAIKVIHPKLLAADGMAERLVREAQSSAAVEHDHIVSIYAVEVHDEAPCIVMPLLRGMTLKQRLEETEGPLALPEVLRIGREAAGGLAAAHAAGLIHCDIKPANLWLEAPHGRVKLLDFGLAIARGDTKEDSGVISGTPGYLAPEQARGFQLDQRTDIFSLGCVLHRMATGVAPFTGPKKLRALWTVLADPPPPASQLNSMVPPALSDLIGSMLAHDPNQRISSANEVVESLSALESRLVEKKTEVARRRWFVAMISVAVMSGSGVAWWEASRTLPNEVPAKITIVGDEPPLAVLIRHDRQEQTLTLGREKTMELSPGDYTIRPVTEQPGMTLVPNHFSVVSGKPQTLRIASVGEIARHAIHTLPVTSIAVMPGNAPTVYSAGLDRVLVEWESSPSKTRFIDLPHSARCLAVSQKGHVVATGGGNKQPPAELEIRVWDRRELSPIGEPVAIHSRMVNSLVYAPNGELLASAGADGVFLWNTNTGESHALVHAEVASVLSLAFSNEGDQLLTGSHEGQIATWDVENRTSLETHTVSDSAVRTVAFLDKRLVAAGDDGIIRIWNEGQLQHEWLGHEAPVLTLAVSPKGDQILSGDADGVIRVWSVASGEAFVLVSGNGQAINAIEFTDNGRRAVSGGADGVVRLWRLPFSD